MELDNKMLPYKLFEKIHLPDHILFTSGACHIFAMELQKLLAAEEYELVRVCVREDGSGGYHVCAIDKSQTFIVDISGIRRSADFRSWIKGFLGVDAVFYPISPEELITPVSTADGLGASNQWGHSVDPVFMEYCQMRAKLIINDFPGRYQCSHILSQPASVNR